MPYQDELARVIEEVIEPAAAEVDRDAAFPRKQVAALADAGLLALTVPASFGGGGEGLRAAAHVTSQIGAVCGSTAMVATMHYAATAALAAAGGAEVLTAIAAGRHLSTLAFSEPGSRSHFWAPLGTAAAAGDAGDEVRLDARKSWVTAAGEADSYVWSSLPLRAGGPMTLWLVPAGAGGLTVAGPFDGLGLRGNASSPMTAEALRVPRDAMIGADGAGLDLALASVLPVFLVCSASMSAGLMRRLAEETAPGAAGLRRVGVPKGVRRRAAVPRLARGAGHGADNGGTARLRRAGTVRPAAAR
jgi:alkylation response protein AidB-like acyl-CoA dehydrogenase